MILGLEIFFFYMNSTKGMLLKKKKNYKFEFIKILKFCSVKDPGKKMRR